MLLQSLLRPVLTPLMRGMFDAPIASSAAWSPLSLWPNGIDTPGMWISPRDLTSQWQDYTGTTPVATPGTVADTSNPVGLALDIRAGATVLTDPGNHMLQSTSAARPLMSARVNLLLLKSPYPFDASDDMTDAAVVDSTVVNAAGTNTITCGAAADVLVRLGKTNPVSAGVTQTLPAGIPFTYSFDITGISAAVGKTVVFTAARAGGPDAVEEITLSAVAQRITATLPAGASVSDIYAYIALKGFGTTANLATSDAIEITNIQLNIGSDAVDYQYADTTALYPSGAPIFKLYDGVDDGMATAAFSAGTLTSGMDCMIAVRRDSAAQVMFASDGPDEYFGLCVDGSGVPNTYAAGSPTVWVDNVQLAGGTSVTAGTIHTALTVGDWHILEFRGLDLSAWASFCFSKYAAELSLNGARGDILLYPSATRFADKFAARQYLADYYGVTLGTPGAPINTTAPVVSGTPASGNTLTCSQGSWTGAVSYAYQWYDQGTPLIGATSSTFALTDAQKGFVMSCMVTATNALGVTDAPSNEVTVDLFPYSGSWIYTTPTTGATPVANTISHADNTVNKLLVSTTNAAGQFVDFSQLRTGDVITINGFAFTVQATPTMYGSYASISIDPTTQQPDATYTITVVRP